MGINAGKKMYATNLLVEAAAAPSLGKGLHEESPHEEELAVLHVGKNLQLPGVMVRRAI